jgi:hypothetical protein
MTRHHVSKSPARLLRSLYIWHRYIGLVAALFVVLLAVTGMLLNHTEELALDARFISSPVLLDWYGIHAPDHTRLYRTGSLAIAGMDNQLYVNGNRISGINGTLHGAVAIRDMIVVALSSQLLLLTSQGELVERLDDATGIPAGIEKIGVSAQQLPVLHTAASDFMPDTELMNWKPAALPHVTWSDSSPASSAEQSALDLAWRGNALSLERVLLDIHSGRIAGRAGVYAVDAAAILFLLLAASGVWLWGRRRASLRAHQHRTRNRIT